MKQYLKPALFVAAIVIISFFVFFNCKGDKVESQSKVDPILLLKLKENSVFLASLKKMLYSKQHELDSLEAVKQKVKYLYKTKYDTILEQAPDTCAPYLTKLNNECLKLDSANQKVINGQKEKVALYDKLDSTYNKNITYRQTIRTTDSTKIDSLSRKLKWQKVKTKASFFLGATIGAGATKVILK